MNFIKFFLFIPLLVFSQKATFYGNVFSLKTNQPLEEVVVKYNNGKDFVLTDREGRFELISKTNLVELHFTGYKSSFFTLKNNRDNKLYLDLEIEYLSKIELKNTQKSSGSKVVSGQIVFDEDYIENAPVTLGEKDVFKILQLTPGVQQGSEGQSGLLVRGGNQGMNLIYIDGIYLHNSSHLGGLFSLINSDFVQKLTFSKTSFDASYGGRLSSITNIKTKNNFDNFFVKGNLGLITSKITTGIPLKFINTKILLSGRRTYLDFIQPLFENRINNDNENSALGKGKSYYFYDYLIKSTSKLNKNNELNFLVYNTADTYKDTDGINVSSSKWQNNVYGFNLKYRLNSQIRNEFYMSKSDYKLGFNASFFPIFFDIQSNYNHFSVKDQVLIRKKNHFIKAGIEFKNINNLPKKLIAKQGETSFDVSNQNNYKYNFTSVFIDDKITLNDKLKLKLGLRRTFFSLQKSSIFSDYNKAVLEPRFSVNYEFKEAQYLKFAYQDLYQFVHQSQIASYSTPIDFFIPSHKNLKPQRGFQYSASYARDLDFINFEISAYYKKINNYAEFLKGSVNTLFLENIYDDVVSGELNAGGLELSANIKFTDKLNGNLNYTLSKTKAKFDELNNGNSFPVVFDRPNNLNMALNYKWSKKLKLGMNFIFKDGQKFTPPKDIRIIDEEPIITFGERNSERYPSYHRMDLFATYNLKNNNRYTSNISLTLYNIYNRKNPFFINYVVGDFNESTEGVEVDIETLFPFIPTINWSFSFK